MSQLYSVKVAISFASAEMNGNNVNKEGTEHMTISEPSETLSTLPSHQSMQESSAVSTTTSKYSRKVHT